MDLTGEWFWPQPEDTFWTYPGEWFWSWLGNATGPLHEGMEKAFFTSPDLHKQIAEAGLKSGDEFKISKVAVQNGRKVTAKVNFEVVAKAPVPVPQPADGVPFEIPDDGFREVMERSLRDAIEATKAVNTVQWDVDSIRSIALTIFIQRART